MTLEALTIDSILDTDAVIIWLHGLGADGYDFVDAIPLLGLPAANSIKFIFPHAPRLPVTLNNGAVMPAWYDIESLDVNSRQDEKGLKEAEALITELINQTIEKGIKPERHLLIGFSQGGAIALHTGLRFDKQLGGIAALSAYLPIHTQLKDQRHPANKAIPIHMAHGLMDPIVTYSMGIHSYSHLKELNYNVSWHAYQIAHEVSLPELKDLGKWIKAKLDIRE